MTTHAKPGRCGVNPNAVFSFEHTPVVADVVHAIVGIHADPVGGGGVGGVIKSWCGNGHRQPRQTFFCQVIAGENNVLNRSAINHGRCDWVGLGFGPFSWNIGWTIDLQSLGINIAGTCHGTEHQRDVVLVAVSIMNVVKIPGLAVFFLEAAKLQPNQRMHFGIFVDWVAITLQ